MESSDSDDSFDKVKHESSSSSVEPPSKKSRDSETKIISIDDAADPETLDSMYSLKDLQQFCAQHDIHVPDHAKKEGLVKIVDSFLKERKKERTK